MARYFNALATLLIFAIFSKLGTLDSVIDKLQISQQALAVGMGLATFGSLCCLQLFSLKASEDPEEHSNASNPEPVRLGINLGGAIVPILFMLFFSRLDPPQFHQLILLTIVVCIVVYPMTRMDKQRGMVIYLFGAVLAAALGSLMLSPDNYLPLAYSAAMLGTLIGGDLLHLTQLRKLTQLNRETVFIGGGGVLDAIFLSGLFAMLTAETLQQLNYL